MRKPRKPMIPIIELWKAIKSAKKDEQQCVNVDAVCLAKFQRKSPKVYLRRLVQYGALLATGDPAVFKLTGKEPPLRKHRDKAVKKNKQKKPFAPTRNAFFKALVEAQSQDGWVQLTPTWQKVFPNRAYSSPVADALYEEGKLSERKKGWGRVAEQYRKSKPDHIPEPQKAELPTVGARVPVTELAALQLLNEKTKQIQLLNKQSVWRIANLEVEFNKCFIFNDEDELNELIEQFCQRGILSNKKITKPNGHEIKIYDVDVEKLAQAIIKAQSPEFRAKQMMRAWEVEIMEAEQRISKRNEQNAQDTMRVNKLKEMLEILKNFSDPGFIIEELSKKK